MGRELQRVALDFDWPIDKTWEGYLNPHYVAVKCPHCENGNSEFGQLLHDRWYGYVAFEPSDRGSVPFDPRHPAIWRFAQRNYPNGDEKQVLREAQRLAGMWNTQWCHHLNQDDVDALVEEGRLHAYTHDWNEEAREWIRRPGVENPSAARVNEDYLSGFGHDAINSWVVIGAEADRLGITLACSHCEGEGDVWPSEEAKKRYENWERIPPPDGPGYQIWQTVSEGGPISPVFETAEELARHMATTRWGADKGTSFEQWMRFIEGPGWAPSMVMIDDRGLISGVQAI